VLADLAAVALGPGRRPAGYCVADLRHGYATVLMEEGYDPSVMQDLMGWSTAAMAEIYVHVRPVMHARAAESLNRRFGGK
jgi:site-specific recombinase XerD